MHILQSSVLTALMPFEVGAERVAAPFRDAYGWFSGLVHARAKAKRLQAEVDQLRQKEIQYRGAAAENQALRKQLNYVDSPRFPADFAPINARVLARPPGEFEQQLVISAGAANGVRPPPPVVTAHRLLRTLTPVAGPEAPGSPLTQHERAAPA